MYPPRTLWLPWLVIILLSVPGLEARGGPVSRPEATGDARPGGREKAIPLFEKGIQKFDAGYYREAIQLFKRAYFHFPSAKIHTRIALCYKWLGDNLKALEHYEKFLKETRQRGEMDKERVLVQQVKVEIKNLLMLVSRLHIHMDRPSGAEIRVNGKLVGTAPMDQIVKLNPGGVNITAIAEGYYPFKRDLKLRGNDRVRVDITLLKIKPKVVKKIVHVDKSVPIWKSWWFWTAIGALVAGGTGAAIGLTLNEQSRDLRGVPVQHDSLSVRF